jgi:hypothetical protein
MGAISPTSYLAGGLPLCRSLRQANPGPFSGHLGSLAEAEADLERARVTAVQKMALHFQAAVSQVFADHPDLVKVGIEVCGSDEQVQVFPDGELEVWEFADIRKTVTAAIGSAVKHQVAGEWACPDAPAQAIQVLAYSPVALWAGA